MEFTDSAHPKPLRPRKDLLQPRRLDTIDAVRSPGRQQRRQERSAMVPVGRADELTVVLEPALDCLARLAVLPGEALPVERLEEITDKREWNRHSVSEREGK